MFRYESKSSPKKFEPMSIPECFPEQFEFELSKTFPSSFKSVAISGLSEGWVPHCKFSTPRLALASILLTVSVWIFSPLWEAQKIANSSFVIPYSSTAPLSSATNA